MPRPNAQSSSESPIVRMQQWGMSKVFNSFPLRRDIAITSLSHIAQPKYKHINCTVKYTDSYIIRDTSRFEFEIDWYLEKTQAENRSTYQ